MVVKVDLRWVILILLIGGLVTSTILYKKKYTDARQNSQQWKNNYEALNDSLESSYDELGRKEQEVKSLKLTTDQLGKKLKEKKARIQTIKKELENSNVEIDKLKHVILANLVSNDSGNTVIKRDTIVKSRDTAKKVLSMDDDNLRFKAWWRQIDSVRYSYSYREKILYWSQMRRKMKNEKGNKRFFLFRWLWPKWQVETNIKSTNENSQINAVQIKKKE